MSQRGRVDRWPVGVLAVMTIVTTAVSGWWIGAHRGGLPFDIDEAGYLQRALRDADALHSGGVGRLVSTVRLPDPQAPLLPATAGLVRWVTGASPYRLVDTSLLFYAVTVVCTYLAARRFTGSKWSLVAAAVVAGMPGMVKNSRQFEFAVPAAALVTAAVAAQLWTGDFRSRRRTLVWGGLLGLATLARTVVVALVPGLAAAAVVQTVARRGSRREFGNVALGLLTGFGVAWSWYSATWHNVLKYLTQYGYGSPSVQYGRPRTIASVGWWTERLTRAVTTELYLPIAASLAVAVVAGAIAYRSGGRPRPRSPRNMLATPEATIAIFLVAGYLALSSSRNGGSAFELPLLPAAVVLCIALAARAAPRVQPAIALVCVGAACASFLDASGAFGFSSTRPVDALRTTAFDGRSVLLTYTVSTEIGCQGSTGCGASTPRSMVAYVRRWPASSQAMATLLADDARTRGRGPVVFFGVQDPLFNTNTVDLAYQQTFADVLPTGLLRRPSDARKSIVDQLEDPALGQPNLVIAGPAAANPVVAAFSVLAPPDATTVALRVDGFVPDGQVTLPDGRVMTAWWKDRGPLTRPSAATP